MPEELRKIFEELNAAHFCAALPLPRLGWNSRLSSTAGRFCPGSRNPLRPRQPQIEVAAYLRDVPSGEMHVRDTVLHEMIHYYLWHEKRPHGHTAEFRLIMNRVGAKRYNTVPKERSFNHWYECPSCAHGFPTYRKLGISACAKCCKKHNNGVFDQRFRLVRKPPRTPETSPKTILRSAPSTAPSPPPEPTRLTPNEVIRRLEQLKELVRARR